MIVDTPLLEIDVSNWHYQFDERAAQGALFESRWYLPEKVRLQRLLEYHEANSVGPLRIDPIVLLDTGAILTVTGSLRDAPLRSSVHGMPIQIHPSLTGAWIVALPTHGGTGSISAGENLIRLLNPKGSVIDSFYLWRTTKPDEFKRASEEQRLLDLFLLSRTGSIPLEEQITAGSLKIDRGFLRIRLSDDTVDIRINYLRPLTTETGEVRAEGRVLQGGRRLAYGDARLVDAAGKLLCHGTGSCLILPR